MLQQCQQFCATDVVKRAIWRGQFQQLVLAVATPVDDVVAAFTVWHQVAENHR